MTGRHRDARLEAKRAEILANADESGRRELAYLSRGVSEESAAAEPVPDEPEPSRDPASLGARLLAGRIRGAEEGYHQSGPPPFGYYRDHNTRGLTVDPNEAPVVRLIFREYLRLRSLKKVIEVLTKLGKKTRRGRTWSRAGVSWILANDTYVGRVHFGPVSRAGNHERIVTPITFNLANALMAKNDKKTRHMERCEHGKRASRCRPCLLEDHRARQRAATSEPAPPSPG